MLNPFAWSPGPTKQTEAHMLYTLQTRHRALDRALRYSAGLVALGLFFLFVQVLAAGAQGISVGQNGTYPVGAIGVSGVFAGADTSSSAATLTGSPGRTTYICGFNVNGLGATAATTVNVAVATVIGGNSLSFQYIMPLGAGVASVPVGTTFSPCVPANAVGSSLTVTVPGAAGNTSTNISAWGYLF